MAVPKRVYLHNLEQNDYAVEWKDCYRLDISLCSQKYKSQVLRTVKVYILKDTFEVKRITTWVRTGTNQVDIDKTPYAHLENQIKEFIEEQRLNILMITAEEPSANSEFTRDSKLFWD